MAPDTKIYYTLGSASAALRACFARFTFLSRWCADEQTPVCRCWRLIDFGIAAPTGTLRGLLVTAELCVAGGIHVLHARELCSCNCETQCRRDGAVPVHAAVRVARGARCLCERHQHRDAPGARHLGPGCAPPCTVGVRCDIATLRLLAAQTAMSTAPCSEVKCASCLQASSCTRL